MSADPQSDRPEWTIGRLLTWTSDYLARQGVSEARLATEVLLAHAIGCRRIDLYTRFEQVPPRDRIDQFREVIRRAAAHEPIAYLVGEKEFFSLSFIVTREVLIPRPETETLVEVALDRWAAAGVQQPVFLDVGTGSGCIAVSLLVNFPGARGVATDISSAALEIAKLNAERHGVADRLTLIEADRLNLPDDVIPTGGFDAVLSNPPYVAADDIRTLDAAVRDYEPMLALSDGGDGLSFFHSLAEGAPRHLKANGLLMVEVADGQERSVAEIMAQGRGLTHRTTVKDRVVGRERVLVFERSTE